MVSANVYHVLAWIVSGISVVQGLTRVFADCPTRVDQMKEPMTLTIKSDEREWEAYAFCESTTHRVFGSYEFEDMTDTVTKKIMVYFETDDPEHCKFMQGADGGVYFISVEVYYPFGDKPYRIVCPYPGSPDDIGRNRTVNETATTGTGINITRPDDTAHDNILHIPRGGPAQSKLAIYLVDIKNQPVGNRRWRFGRYLKLAAEMVEARGNEVSFQIHNCMALSVSSGKRQYFIKDGCGDGIVVPEDQGFITEGPIAYSVPFKAFHLQDSIKVVFMCSFLLCSQNCDGPSCEATPVVLPERRPLGKREASSIRMDTDFGNETLVWVSPDTDIDDPDIRPMLIEKRMFVPHTTETPELQEDETFSKAKIDIFISISFFLSVLSVVTTGSFLLCRWVSARRRDQELEEGSVL